MPQRTTPTTPPPRRNAMTIIELMVVFIIVAVTSSIAVVGMNNARDNTATRANIADVSAIRASGRTVASANASTFPVDLATRLSVTAMDVVPNAKSTGSLIMSVVRVTSTIASYSVRSGDGCVGVLDDLTSGTITWVLDEQTADDNCHAGILGARRAEPELAGASTEKTPLAFDYDRDVPFAPTDLIASQPVPGPVVLDWTAVPSTTHTGYTLFRDAGTGMTSIGTAAADADTFNDTTAPGGDNVTYEIRADYPTNPTNTTSAPAVLLTRPGAPTITGYGTGEVMDIEWSGSGPIVSSYRLQIDAVPIKTTTTALYAHATTSPVAFLANTTFVYTVIANNASGDGLPGTLSKLTHPAPPTGLTVEDRQSSRLDLSWLPSPGATSYEIWREGALLATTPSIACVNPTEAAAGKVCYLDPTGANTLINGTNYTYTVRAESINGISGDSLPASGIPFNTPGTPTGLAAVPDNTQVAVTWNALITSAANKVGGYRIYMDGTAVGIVVGATNTSYVVTGLNNGQLYSFQVVAYYRDQEGAPSSAVSATPRTVPDPPVLQSATGGNVTGTLIWTAPAWNGGSPIDTYTATATSSGHPTRTCTTTAPTVTCVIGSVVNGVTYNVSVTAHNVAGDGAASNVRTFKPRTVPNAPTGVNATCASPTSAQITFNAPAWNGGDPITSYIATSSGAQTSSGAGSPRTVTGLTAGVDYTFTVRATNGAGTGPASAASGVLRCITAPGQVTGVAASPGNTVANVTWNQITGTAAAPMTGYHLFVNGGYNTTVGLQGSRTIGGLSNGTTYTITVQAYGPGGAGPVSAGALVTPRTVPDAPWGQYSTVNGTSAANVYWNTPGNGGAAIQGYKTYMYNSGGGFLGGPYYGNSGVVIGGLSSGTTYLFRILAYNAAGDGPLSGYTAPLTVGPGAPPYVNVGHCSNNSPTGAWPSCFLVQWGAGANATSYDIYRNGVIIKSGFTGTQFYDAAVWANTGYSYQIVSRNGPGSAVSPTSAAISYASGAISTRLPCHPAYGWRNYAWAGIIAANGGALEVGTNDYCWYFGEGGNDYERSVYPYSGGPLDSNDSVPLLRNSFTIATTFNTPTLQGGLRLLLGTDATPPNSAGLYLIDGQPSMCGWFSGTNSRFCTSYAGQISTNRNYLMVGRWHRGWGLFMAVYDIDNGTYHMQGTVGNGYDIWVDSYRASTGEFYLTAGGAIRSTNPFFQYQYTGALFDSEIWAG